MSWAMWITGVPGSGKSVLAQAVAELRARGEPVRVLEIDEIARALTPEPRRTDAEREVVHRALGYMASLLTEIGVPVIIDAAAHRRAWRDLARASIPRFAEVHVACPPEVALERARVASGAPNGCVERGWHARSTARAVELPYEPPLAPELVVESTSESVPHAAQRIVGLAQRLERRRDAGRCDHRPRPSPPSVQPAGVPSHRDDLGRRAAPGGAGQRDHVGPAITAESSQDVAEAARIMLEGNIGSLPVVDGGRLVGIITETDLLRELCRADAACSPEVTDVVVSYP